MSDKVGQMSEAIELSQDEAVMLCVALEYESNSSNQMANKSWASRCYRLRAKLAMHYRLEGWEDCMSDAANEEKCYQEWLDKQESGDDDDHDK